MTERKKGMSQRSLNALETKNKLLSTAMMLFTQRGYEKVTVDDITRFAGVSKGTFYNHFSTKDEVLVEQFNRIDDYYEQIFRHIKPTESASARVLIFVDAMCEYCGNIWGLNLLKIVYSNQISLGNRPNILLNKERQFYIFLRDIVRHGVATGEFTAEIPQEEQVAMFSRMARSVLYEWCLHDGDHDLKESGHKAFELVLKLIRA
ncbi:MAG: hypothetical protein DELT_01399 [Desulfovibrio sp.]